MTDTSTVPSTRVLEIAAVAALLVSGGTHLQQYVAGYSSLSIVGPLFLAHAVAAVALAAWLLLGSRTTVPAVAGIVLELGSLASLAASFVGTFLGTSESGLRPATTITIVSEVAAVVLLGVLLVRGSRLASRSRAGVG